MKIIDLLQMIANGEEVPKKFELLSNNEIFNYDNETGDYNGENGDYLFGEVITNVMNLQVFLNDEVEIIEEDKKIEKLDSFDIAKQDEDEIEPDTVLELDYEGVSKTFNKVYHKINELIDKVNNLQNK